MYMLILKKPLVPLANLKKNRPIRTMFGPGFSCARVEIGGGGWGLELNFLGFQIEENFWEAKF